ncbi:MAG: ribosomal protein L7/L12 [Rhodanobacteraceae bacterium]
MKLYQVDLDGPFQDKTSVVKALRTIGGLSLKKANDIFLYMHASKHVTVIAGVTNDVAEEIARNLRASGLGTTVAVSSVASPMLVDKSVEQVFVWGKSHRLTRKG